MKIVEIETQSFGNIVCDYIIMDQFKLQNIIEVTAADHNITFGDLQILNGQDMD